MPKTVALVTVRQAKNVNLRRRYVFTAAYNAEQISEAKAFNAAPLMNRQH